MLSVNSINNAPSFKQVNVIKVPKKLFKTPKTYEKYTSRLQNNLSKANKPYIMININDNCLMNGNCNVSFSLETDKISKKEILLPKDMFIFNVLTGEDVNRFAKIVKEDNIAEQVKEKKEDIFCFINKKIKDFCADTTVIEYNIEKLSDLTKIVPKL